MEALDAGHEPPAEQGTPNAAHRSTPRKEEVKAHSLTPSDNNWPRAGVDRVVQLVSLCRPDLLACARSALGVYADHAQDVVSETICMALQGRIVLPSNDTRRLAYMKGVIRHVAAHVVRGEARLAPFADEVVKGEDVEAFDIAIRTLRHRDLRQALQELTEGELDVVTRRFFLGRSVRQTAAERHVKLQTVKELERRALRKMRARLAARTPT